jgi:hypothetical protein
LLKQTSQSKDVQTQNINKHSNELDQTDRERRAKHSVSGANRWTLFYERGVGAVRLIN